MRLGGCSCHRMQVYMAELTFQGNILRIEHIMYIFQYLSMAVCGALFECQLRYAFACGKRLFNAFDGWALCDCMLFWGRIWMTDFPYGVDKSISQKHLHIHPQTNPIAKHTRKCISPQCVEPVRVKRQFKWQSNPIVYAILIATI